MPLDVYEAIARRRTIKQYSGQEIPREVIERLIAAAVWAPNHHLTKPWRFSVLTGPAKDGLAALRCQQVMENMPDPTAPGSRLKIDEAYRKMAGRRADPLAGSRSRDRLMARA